MSSHVFATRKLDSTRQLRRWKMEELLAEVHKIACAGVPVEIGEIGFMTACNFLSNALFSMALIKPGSEDGSKELSSLMRLLIVELGKLNLADYFPVLKWIDPNGRKHQAAARYSRWSDQQEAQAKEKTS